MGKLPEQTFGSKRGQKVREVLEEIKEKERVRLLNVRQIQDICPDVAC